MTTFKDLGLAAPILRALDAQNYSKPTPIQAKVIPEMLNGRDIVGVAQTGTGKTAAFVLPILQQIHSLGTAPKPKTCRALIVAPTRELALQIGENAKSYAHFGHQSVAVIMGGVKAGSQIKQLAKGVDILVATPGRLEDLKQQGHIRLDDVSVVVLDEADQMMDMGFIPAIRRIMKAVPKQRQTLLLSATMPKAIRRLASDFLSNPFEVEITPQAKPVERIEQFVVHVEKTHKRKVLTALIKEAQPYRAIVFTRTKRGADRVSRHLEKAGFAAQAIHGDRSQNQRRRALDGFKDGNVQILVATDIAARGIDVDDVTHVYNYELPNISESYVHRIGRTARAGKSGIAVSLCDSEERDYLRDIEKLTKVTLTPRTIDVPDVPEPPVHTPKPQRQKSQGQNPQGGQKKKRSRGRKRSRGGQRSRAAQG